MNKTVNKGMLGSLLTGIGSVINLCPESRGEFTSAQVREKIAAARKARVARLMESRPTRKVRIVTLFESALKADKLIDPEIARQVLEQYAKQLSLSETQTTSAESGATEQVEELETHDREQQHAQSGS